MTTYWTDHLHETDHLRLDVHGTVTVSRLRDPETGLERETEDRIVLGDVGSDPRWPASLGPEPPWYLTELAGLVEAMDDAERFAAGCKAAARATDNFLRSF